MDVYYDQPKISTSNLNFLGTSTGNFTTGVLNNINNVYLFGSSQLNYMKEDNQNDLIFNLTLQDHSTFHIFGEYQVGSSYMEVIGHSTLYIEEDAVLSQSSTTISGTVFTICEYATVHVLGSISSFSAILIKDNASLYLNGHSATGIYPKKINITMCGNSYLEVGGSVQLLSENLTLFDNARAVFKDNMSVYVFIFSLFDSFQGMLLFLHNNSSLYFDVYDKTHSVDGIVSTVMYDTSKIVFHGRNHGFLYRVDMNDNSMIEIKDSIDVTLTHVHLNDNSIIKVSDTSKVILANLESSSTSRIVFNGEGKMSLRCSNGEYVDDCLFEESVINFNGFPFDFTNISLHSTPLNLYATELHFDDSTLNNTILPIDRCINIISIGDDATIPTFTNKHFYTLFDKHLVRYCPDSFDRNTEKTYCSLIDEQWNNKHLFDRNYPFDQAHCPYNNVEVVTFLNRVVIGNQKVLAKFLNETNLVFSVVTTNVQKVSGLLREVTFPSGVVIKSLCSVIENVAVELLSNGSYSYSSICKMFVGTNDSTNSDTQKVSEIKGVSESGYIVIDEETIIASTDFGLLIYISNQLKPSTITTTFNSNILVIGNIGFYVNEELCTYGRVTSTLSECYKYDKLRCDDGYYVSEMSCVKCTSNCIKCTEFECILCADNYILSGSVCEKKPTSCLVARNNFCFECKDTYSQMGTTCLNTSPLPNCTISRNNLCVKCSSDLMVIKDGVCVQYDKAILTTKFSVVACEIGYYTFNGTCHKCSDKHQNCLMCDLTKCYLCENGYDIQSDGLCKSQNCETYSSIDICIQCKDGYIFGESKNGYYLSNGICVSFIANCMTGNNTGCTRCNSGYYLNTLKLCEKCQSNCLTCGTSPSNCLSCDENTFLSENKCVTSSKYNNTCDRYTSNGFCVHCISGYYLYQDSCRECLSSCDICSNKYYCITCKDGYFMSSFGECLDNKQAGACSVNVSTSLGCIRCDPGNYLNGRQCIPCTLGCISCDSTKCFTCYDKFVLQDGKCVSYYFVSNCLSAHDGQCSSCSFWYTPDRNGSYCERSAVWWVILLIVIVCLALISIIVVVIVHILYRIISKYVRNRNLDDLVFDISQTGVLTHELIQGLYTNVSQIIFDGDNTQLPVFKESVTSFVLANKGKQTVRVQVKGRRNKYRYTIEVTPPVVLLKRDQACQFTVLVEPKCTCRINDVISIFINDIKKPKGENVTLPVLAESAMSSFLDQTEIEVKRLVGEGTFGKVFLCVFRGQHVALKVMKQINIEQQSPDEFNKEIEMLTKFRCDQIIHFFGSVRMARIVGLVVEYAPLGSLRNIFMNKEIDEVCDKMKVKFMIDTTQALLYLHTNGVLHRDVKPDNVLVFNKTSIITTNVKLSDFGSSRNINLFLSNMSFTKGIGTPVYMAPEIYNKNKYSQAADVYALGITLLECMKWDEAYENKTFVYSFQIPDFINKGNRLPKPANVSNEMFAIVQACWDQTPKNRPTTQTILERLNQIEEKLPMF
ncbi:protein serine/threonine kinase, putative [Entamoeba invadens IP1]|uniref:Protein serine/threonine kinase, putative n=1 Tax=Entamoeba invadens IP1 TaxID=370355 RepID=L7FMY0_ENTIV|nr:protein serine/threonine kinase, putative [Entamoeba invadens IP1]ELP92222.1 protein serine/threonine kinase, putative [Entamoeba invadens IP1]|eukprot:XP_004258993.1 protein serine/threonine kinase, putative [Entamoeba invadens IP1]